MCSTASQQALSKKSNNGNVHSQVIVSDHRFMPQEVSSVCLLLGSSVHELSVATLKNNLHKLSLLHDCLKDKTIPS